MSFWMFILRSLKFRFRSHLGILAGAAVASAALIGALLVGDSVRGSLLANALERIGPFHYAMAPADRFFRAELGADIAGAIKKPDSNSAARICPETASLLS